MYETNKEDFFIWLDKYSKIYKTNVKNSLDKLISKDKYLTKHINFYLNENPKFKKSGSVAFRVFLNYLEELELLEFSEIDYLRKKVKLYNKTNVDSFVPNKQEIENSIKHILENFDDTYLILYLLMLESGARFTELKNMILTFDRSKLEYHDKIVIYRNFYLRNNKNSYYLFFTKQTLERLFIIIETIDETYLNSFKKKVAYTKKVINLKYLRKYQYTQMINLGINFEIADFIQGRASKNIGFNHYLAKKELALKEYKKLLDKFLNKKNIL